VPFGKAAFMPGRLIHTNEFLVWNLMLLSDAFVVCGSLKMSFDHSLWMDTSDGLSCKNWF
jgi:hypothetical protein